MVLIESGLLSMHDQLTEGILERPDSIGFKKLQIAELF